MRRLALELGAHSAAVNSAFEDGGAGAAELAEAVVDGRRPAERFEPIYPLDAPIADKIEAIAKRVYGADGIFLLPAAENDIKRFTAQGLDRVPICMAKTHLSLSHDPDLTGAPTGFTVPVRAVRAYTGAGLARRPLRRHADDARALGDAGRVQRRHRRERPNRRPLLRPLAAGPAIARTIELAARLTILTARTAGRADLAQRARPLAERGGAARRARTPPPTASSWPRARRSRGS